MAISGSPAPPDGIGIAIAIGETLGALEAPTLAEILLQTATMPWREKSLPGIFEKRLWTDVQTGGSISLNRYLAGSGIPAPHSHASNQFMFCLQGRYEYTATGTVLVPGCFYGNPKGNIHGPTVAHEESVLLEIYDGPHYPIRPAWYTDDADAR